MLAEYYSLADYSFVSSYSEELIEVQGILSLPAADMFDSLAAFLDENPSFDINRKLGDKTLLEYACGTNNPRIVKLILDQPNIDISQGNAFDIVCENENEEIGRLLLPLVPEWASQPEYAAFIERIKN